jgi:IS605 OrfB family transposase
MAISYKYRIYPNKATEQKLSESLDTCRWLYNRLLQELNEANDRGIVLGKLDTQNMIPSLKLENHNLTFHRNIHDASWSRFIFMLSYKAESAGKKLIKVDPPKTLLRGVLLVDAS